MLDSNRKTIDPCLTRFRHKVFVEILLFQAPLEKPN